MAGPLLREFTVRIEEEAGEPPQPIGENTYYLLDENGIQHLTFRKDGQVFCIRTNAPADLRAHLNDFTALLTD